MIIDPVSDFKAFVAYDTLQSFLCFFPSLLVIALIWMKLMALGRKYNQDSIQFTDTVEKGSILKR